MLLWLLIIILGVKLCYIFFNTKNKKSGIMCSIHIMLFIIVCIACFPQIIQYNSICHSSLNEEVSHVNAYFLQRILAIRQLCLRYNISDKDYNTLVYDIKLSEDDIVDIIPQISIFQKAWLIESSRFCQIQADKIINLVNSYNMCTNNITGLYFWQPEKLMPNTITLYNIIVD